MNDSQKKLRVVREGERLMRRSVAMRLVPDWLAEIDLHA